MNDKKLLNRTFSKVINNSKLDDSKIISKSIDKLACALEEYNKNYKQFLQLEKKKILLESKKLNK